MSLKRTNLKESKITMKKLKKQVKRNYTYSVSRYNYCPFDFSWNST